MKKFFEAALIAVILTAAAGFASHFEAKQELISLFKNVAHKIVPWVKDIVYT